MKTILRLVWILLAYILCSSVMMAQTTHAISGNAGAENVVLNWDDGGIKGTTSGVDSTYTLQVSDGWSGTVTPIKPGFTFTPENRSYTNVTGDISNENYVAAIKTYTLSINAINGSVTKNPNTATYDSGSVVQLKAIPATGYHFVNWSGDTSSTNVDSAWVTMDGDKNVTATFAINTYTITVTAIGNGTVDINPVQATYDYNSVVTLTANPGSGSSFFIGWSGSISGNTNPYTTDTVRANQTITAYFGSTITSNGTGGGNWNNTSTWTGSVLPILTDSVIILGGDLVSVPLAGGTKDTCGSIVIQAGGTLRVDTNFVVRYGSMTVNGTLIDTLSGDIRVSGARIFGINSLYRHARIAGALPTDLGGTQPSIITWGTGSTCIITGTTANTPGNIIHDFYNFIWNCPGQSTNLNMAWDNLTVKGDVTCISSGTGQLRLTSAATVRTITINGNVILQGGIFTASGSSGAAQYNITVKGNIDIPSGQFNLCGGSGGFGTWRLWGNLTIGSTGKFLVPSNKTINTILIFAGGGAQSYTCAAGGTNANLSYGVENGSVVTLNSPLTVGNTTAGQGGLVLTSGKFVTTSSNLMTLASAASITTGTGYISGPLAETVAATSKTLTFPIGKSAYRPIILNLTLDAATSTVYTAELFDTTPPSNTLPLALDAVSTARYVHILKSAGANVTSGSINMTYDATDGLNVSNKDSIRIAKDDKAGHWISLGGSGSADNSGNITSGNAFGLGTAYGALDTNDFVLAHADPTFVPSVATISTNEITDISTTFATSGGTFISDGGAAITAKGVCWNTTGSPTISDTITSDGVTSNPFASSITGLTIGTTYFVRAYATNSAGTAYGNERSFTTLTTLSVPTLTTDSVQNIVNKSATGYGTVTLWGGSAVTDRGICWSTSHNPTVADDYNNSGTGSGSFNVPIGGLTLGTIYYVRAFATNSTGTGYGNEISFETPVGQPDVYKLVDKNGTVGVTCDYTTLQAAFDAVTPNYTGHWFIYVKKGTYYEKTWLISTKINVVIVGESRDSTIITFDDYAGKNTVTHFAAGDIISNGTNTSFTCAIDAPDFQAQNITFQNTANAYAPGSTASQAVALRTNGDRQDYYNCRMLGYQDTYYTQGGLTGPDRIYNKQCYIEGAVDFIFGRDVALFDSCTIFCNRNGGVLTAGATEVGYTYGYVFKACSLASTPAGVKGCDSVAMVSFYLGRPWQAAPKTVYLDCYEPATVNAAGWTTMGPNPALYSEYSCSGPGYVTSRPVIWAGTGQPSAITDSAAATYTIANIFSKNNKGSGFSYAANWTPLKIVYAPPTSVENNGTSQVPRIFALYQNYPNPFNPSTQIQFSVPKDGRATLKVYNVLGQEVATLFDETARSGQLITREFSGSTLASGVYFARLQYNGNSQVKRMMLLK